MCFVSVSPQFGSDKGVAVTLVTFVCVADSYLAAEFSLRAQHLPVIKLVLVRGNPLYSGQ